MDSVKDFFQSIYDSYTDRIKSPFIGSFILSFVIFNWRAFAILFYSEWPIHCRIEWVEEKYCVLENFWYPVFISLFYILILPYINLGFERLLSMYTNKKQLKINFKRNANLIRQKGEAAILKEIADIEAGTSQINDLKEKIDTLQHELSDLTTQNQEDLKRHMKAIELARNKEINYNKEIKALMIFAEQGWAKDLNIDFNDLTLSMIKEVINIADSFSEAERKRFLDFVIVLGSDRDFANVKDLLKYEEMGLIEAYPENGINKTHLTRLGISLIEYLNKGLDIM